MKISKGTLGIALGVYGLAASAQADVFNPSHPVSELHSVNSGNTAGSFAASAMMGVQGFNGNPPFANWEVQLVSNCANQPGFTVWPGGCNPTKMRDTLHALSNNSWATITWPEAQQAAALNELVASLQIHGSPAVVPIYGQADHWVAIVQITATQSGGNWNISNVKYYDGGPKTGADGSGNGYEGGLQSYSGSVWKNVYFRVLENINPACDPCTSDPWYDQYVLVWEPPPGQEHTNIVTHFQRSPGVLGGGMNDVLARMLVWNSLTTAGIQNDPQVWNAIRDGRAGAAVEVNGVAPNGDRWDYFLVPILSAEHTAVAFVQLAADDGAFETVHVLPAPSHFDPVNRARAEHLARKALGRGESLAAGVVTWDPRSHSALAKSPTAPYYEFGVIAGDQETGVVRVDFKTGEVERVAK